MTVLFKGIKKERISRLGYPLFAYAEGDADVTVQNCDNVWGCLIDKLEFGLLLRFGMIFNTELIQISNSGSFCVQCGYNIL